MTERHDNSVSKINSEKGLETEIREDIRGIFHSLSMFTNTDCAMQKLQNYISYFSLRPINNNSILTN